MTRGLILVTCLLIIECIQQTQATNCLNYNGGYFYTATTLGQNCSTVCSSYGGLDMVATRHAGNAVGQHFYPSKVNGNNWRTIECSSVDSNTNWGGTGEVPDASWYHDLCYIHCACNILPPNVDSCDRDLCYGVAEGGDCRGGSGTSCGSYKCLQGVCTLDTSTNVTNCGNDTQCRVYSCARGECLSADINNDQPCTPPDSSSSECQEFVCSQGECVARAINEGNACLYDSCTAGICGEGTCVADYALPDGTACTDDNACTLNDVCSNGECHGNTTLDCGQCSTCDPLLGCWANKNVTCDDGDDTTCDDTCRFDFFTPLGACVGNKCSTPEATTSPSSPSSTTPSGSVFSSASFVMAVPHLILALSALM